MKRIKVTVTEFLTLSPGAELVENFVSEGEDLGPHVCIEGQHYAPAMVWMRFEPPSDSLSDERPLGLGNRYRSCPDDQVYDHYLAAAAIPVVSHAIEVIAEGG